MGNLNVLLMADRIYLKINGIDAILEKLSSMSVKIQEDVVNELNASALKIQSDAKRDVPINMGTLRNSIQLTERRENTALIYEVGSKLNYAPYMEFGTGGKVTIPSGYNDFANQFKGSQGGKGGTFKDLLLALIDWVNKKGIAGTYSTKTQRRTGGKSLQSTQNKSLAYAIAISILRKGLRPQPYLIPAFETEKPKLIKKIKEITENVKS